MQPKIDKSPILTEFHNENLKLHKHFLKLLLEKERIAERLKKKFEEDEIKAKEHEEKEELAQLLSRDTDSLYIEKKRKGPGRPKKLGRPKKRKYVPVPKSKRKKPGKTPIEKVTPEPRPRGRPRVCFDYETAKAIVQDEMIQSGPQYKMWLKINNPARMPKNPERAYKKEWTGWGDFLGVYNPGVKKGRRKYRSFVEAKAFVLSLNLRSQGDWRDYVRSGACPEDIPHRPDSYYGKSTIKHKVPWTSWVRRGKNGKYSTNNIEKIKPILYIARSKKNIQNLYIINTIPGGIPALQDHINKLNLNVIAAFWANTEFKHREYLDSLDRYTYGGTDEYMLANVYENIELLSTHLSLVRA